MREQGNIDPKYPRTKTRSILKTQLISAAADPCPRALSVPPFANQMHRLSARNTCAPRNAVRVLKPEARLRFEKAVRGIALKHCAKKEQRAYPSADSNPRFSEPRRITKKLETFAPASMFLNER